MNTEAKYFTLDDAQPGAIRPELVAEKIADVRRLKYRKLAEYIETQPRTFEAFWFIQSMSMQPGGLQKFTTELIAFIGPRIGTASMRKFGSRHYTRDEASQVWQEMPRSLRRTCRWEETTELDDFIFSDERLSEQPSQAKVQRELVNHVFKENEPMMRQLVQERVAETLGGFLEKLCVGDEQAPDRWYCADVITEVLAFMEHRAAQIETRLACTCVTEKVFDALDYASSERVMVRLTGDSRFGKTESVETWAAMWPGRARVVRTLPSNSERDLIRATAEALGIHQTFGSRGETLKDKVEFVIRFSGLMVIFDEGAFLLPGSFTATTAPGRLNWIRSAIIDRKVPCVIVVTPQSYEGAVSRFTKKTGYSIEQWIGREALRVDLPNELSHEDLLAVARVHFPEADEDLLGLIVAKAMQSESFLKAVENIARRARYNAKKRGAKRLRLSDVDTAIAEVMPAATVTPAQPPSRAPQRRRSATAHAMQPGRSNAAEAFRAGQAEQISSIPKRATTPAHDADLVAAVG